MQAAEKIMVGLIVVMVVWALASVLYTADRVFHCRQAGFYGAIVSPFFEYQCVESKPWQN